jgi:uncharacterized RDD family membrane protein YckC
VCAFSSVARPAAFWRRFVAYALDSFILFFIVAIMFRPLFRAPTELERAILRQGPSSPLLQNAAGVGSLPFLFATALPLLFFLAGFVYFGLFESSRWMATPGKRLVGIHVEDEQGDRLRVTRALARHLARGLSMVTAHLGFLLALFTPQRRALHDLLAGTRVVVASPEVAGKKRPGGIESTLKRRP